VVYIFLVPRKRKLLLAKTRIGEKDVSENDGADADRFDPADTRSVARGTARVERDYQTGIARGALLACDTREGASGDPTRWGPPARPEDALKDLEHITGAK